MHFLLGVRCNNYTIGRSIIGKKVELTSFNAVKNRELLVGGNASSGANANRAAVGAVKQKPLRGQWQKTVERTP
jgi:hypothetical protein